METNDKSNDPIKLHVAGATVRHKSPFDDVPTPLSKEELSLQFIEKWVRHFYMTYVTSADFLTHYTKIKDELKPEIVEKLLSDFNWRTRKTGAIFAALKNYNQFEEVIGNLFLKSEVCCAGTGYCLALASFNSEKSIDYLDKYLNYYLLKPELYFDQNTAMAAVAYLDSLNNTNHLEKYRIQWNEFVKGKQGWYLDKSISSFKEHMNAINKIKLLN